jgi:hypothetical protein
VPPSPNADQVPNGIGFGWCRQAIKAQYAFVVAVLRHGARQYPFSFLPSLRELAAAWHSGDTQQIAGMIGRRSPF